MKKNIIKFASFLAVTTLLSGFITACDSIEYRMYQNNIPRYWGGDYNPFTPNADDDWYDYYEDYSSSNKKSSSNNNNKKSSSSKDDGQYTSWDYFSHTYAYAGAGQVAIKAKASCRELLNVYVPKIYTDDKGNEYQVATDYDEGFENLSSTSITLPDGFEKINIGFDNSFYLKKIYLPASIIKIEGEIITNCLSLETINFKGTKAQWEAINKDERWNYQAPAFDISCSDGIINVPKWSEPAS